MINPLNTIRKIRSRIGKPIRTIIEVQNDCSVVEITTDSIRDGNLIRDISHDKTWALPVGSKTVAIYIDGIFKGMGHFATEEGVVVNVENEVKLQKEVKTTDNAGKPIIENKPLGFRLTFTGIFSKLIDAAIIEKGSALKQTWTTSMILIFLFGCMTAFMMGMSYAS